MSNNCINVLVTAIGGGGHGEQILKALNLANEGQYRIFGADMNPDCPQFSQVIDRLVLPPASEPNFINAVLEGCRAFNISALFHGCEPELMAYSRNRNLFTTQGILLPINKHAVIEACMDKVRTGSILADLGFSPPKFILATNVDTALQMEIFPLVIKPHIGSGGSKDCFVVQDRRELLAIMSFLNISEINPILVQEYVGTPDDEYTVGVLHDLDGHYLNAIAIRRQLKSALNLRISTPNRTGRSELGSRLVVSSGISMGEVCSPSEILDVCTKIAKNLDVRGAVNIQGRMTPDGFKVFEINPRFSGTTSIRAIMGYNEPDILLRRHLLGEKIQPNFEYSHGLVLRNLVESRV
jgi:carbamoyl-phosphate synthase large subunit